LFVAVLGTESDGHDFVMAAIARGASAVLAEHWLPTGNVPLCVVEDTREALGIICHALAGNPAQQLPVIGVTGTNGKTTTTCLIASILRVAGHLPALSGTLGYCDGRRTQPAPLTTPPAPLLAHWLARSHAREATHAVLEVSSHALAQRRTAGLELDVACVTNVRRDHLDFHGTVASYRAAKARIFDQLRDGGVAVLNIDDAACREYLQNIDGPVLTYGMNRDAQVSATVIERHRSEQTFLLTAGNETVPVRTAIIGDHHVANCLAAATVALVYGIDLETIARGLERITTMPGRLERIECGQPFSVFVDYAHTPDALETVLAAVRQVCSGRVICVFGAGGNRDKAKRPLMGRAVEQGADVAIITDDNPRQERPKAIASQILRGFKQPRSAVVIHDRKTAIHTALAAAEPGDCVLIAGKGHETAQVVGRRRLEFDDREVARQWLYTTDADWTAMPVLRRAA
jgi:UDP-N-acetylmuramoyl-L-alanyl-D-glutamate--2,6-diaminopimelate ligase